VLIEPGTGAIVYRRSATATDHSRPKESAMSDTFPAGELHALADALAGLYDGIHEQAIVPDVTPEGLRERIAAEFNGFAAPQPLGDVLHRTMRLLRDGTVHVTHPRYFGLFNPSVLPAAVMGDLLTAAVNPQLAAWSHAPAANELERYLIDFFGMRVGLPEDTRAGCFCSGGAEANHMGILVALTRAFPDFPAAGLRALDAQPVLYMTAESHHSVSKAAAASGLGQQAVRTVPVDADLRLDVQALAEQVARDRREGLRPFLVVGTAGTTAAGTIDPLAELADLCASERLWLHVDAAWGGAAVLSPRLRPHLRGIERSDSVTIDAHKWLQVPMGAGMFLCRHGDLLPAAFGLRTGYMPVSVGGTDDPYATTLQWSRRCIGLKLLVALATLGETGYRELIERMVALGDRLRVALPSTGWEVVNATPLPVICFSHPRLRSGAVNPHALLPHFYHSNVWVSPVRLASDLTALRACVTSFRTREEDIDALVAAVRSAPLQ
jgi:glutamate/tyrosine decarboxylase-like PLP-dependent enzyme